MICGVAATSISGCDVCNVYRVVCDPGYTLHGTQYTHHSLKYLLPQRRISYNDVFLLISSTNCSFSKAQHTLPEDGPIGPKHVGANMRYFNCTF